MNSHTTVDSLLDTNYIANARSTIESNDLPFSEMADLLKLDKENDFQHADLCRVDFSNSDLRGFDFTGSNLKFSYGHSIIFDNTTIFNNADIEPSFFSFEIKKRKFDNDHRYNSYYNKLRHSDWTEISIWAHGLKSNEITSSEAMLAKQLLAERIPPTAKVDLAINAKKYFNSYSEIAEFIYFCTSSSAFQDSDGDFDFIAAFGEAYVDNIEVYNAFDSIKYFGNFDIQEKILNILISSNIDKSKNRIKLFNEFNSTRGKKLRTHISQRIRRSLHENKKYIFEDNFGLATSDVFSLDRTELIQLAMKKLNDKFKINGDLGKKFGIKTRLPTEVILQKTSEIRSEKDFYIFKNVLLRNMMKIGLAKRALTQNKLIKKERERVERAVSNSYRRGNRNY